jgi:hypothetical protein
MANFLRSWLCLIGAQGMALAKFLDLSRQKLPPLEARALKQGIMGFELIILMQLVLLALSWTIWLIYRATPHDIPLLLRYQDDLSLFKPKEDIPR